MSTSASNRRRDPGGVSEELILLWLVIGLVIVVGAPVYVAMHVGHAIADDGVSVPANPFAVLFGLISGSLPWPGAPGWVGLGLAVALMAALIGLVVMAVRWRRARRSRVDVRASYLGRGGEVVDLGRTAASAKAQRMGVDSPGVPIGRTVAGDQPLYGSWEDMHTDIWGPRTGKTTSRAIPAVLDAPGSVLVTSNKRDIVDATRDPRARAGQVWVFDPQGIAMERASWWWNPLSYVTDEVRAAKLAEHFASGSRDPGARTDAYFDPAGQDLLAGLLLAAAVDRRPITDVYTWLTRPTDETAVDILRDGGFPLIADQVAGVVSAPDKQRGGVFGTAQQMASCLINRQIVDWVTPQGAADPRPQLRPEAFVQVPGGTLYSLSKEGRGTAGPLVTALTVAVVEAAFGAATACASRFPEAACRRLCSGCSTRRPMCAGGASCPTSTATTARGGSC